MLYLDYSATTPMSETALHVYTEVARRFFANTSSLHDLGTNAEQLLEQCRTNFASLLNVRPQTIVFTSGGTEGNHLAVMTLLHEQRHKGKHIVTTPAEHASLRSLWAKLETEGYEVSYIPLTKDGTVCLTTLAASIRPDTALCSIHHVNPEIGVVQPLEAIAAELAPHGILFHSDTVQSFGKLTIPAHCLHAFTVSSHKVYGPKGVGAIYLDDKIVKGGYLPGVTHENGWRAGTVNLPGIASFVQASSEKLGVQADEYDHVTALRRQLVTQLHEANSPYIVYEGGVQLPHIFSFGLHGVEGQWVMLQCNREQIAISTGSACQVGKQEPAATLVSIGYGEDEAKQLARASFSIHTTSAQIDQFVTCLLKAAATLLA